MPPAPDPTEPQWLPQARAGDSRAFDRLVAPYRRRLHGHCYRMLGSPHDADEALQDALLAAWRGLASFEGRSALGTWLYQIATNVCLRLISRRPRRMESPGYGPALQSTADLGQFVAGPVWLEPLSDDKLPAVSQAAELRSLGEERLDKLLSAFVVAWESRNIEELVRLFTEDVRFTMPPLPAWFDGRAFVEKFIVERVFATPWRLQALRANGQVGFACYMKPEGSERFRLGAITLLSLREGRIAGLHSFPSPPFTGVLVCLKKFLDRSSPRPMSFGVAPSLKG